MGPAVSQTQIFVAMRRLRSYLARFWRAKGGAAAVEYALVLAIVCCGIAVGASKMSGSVDNAISQVAACLELPNGCLALD